MRITQESDNHDGSFDNLFGRLSGIAAQFEELADALKEYIVPEGRPFSHKYEHMYQKRVCW